MLMMMLAFGNTFQHLDAFKYILKTFMPEWYYNISNLFKEIHPLFNVHDIWANPEEIGNDMNRIHFNKL